MTFDFSSDKYNTSDITKLVIYWYLFFVLLRFSVLDYTFPMFVILGPLWLFLMGMGFYNYFNIYNYLYDNNLISESTIYNKSLIRRKLKELDSEPQIKIYNQNSNKFFKIILGVLISIPFLVFLFGINWNVK